MPQVPGDGVDLLNLVPGVYGPRETRGIAPVQPFAWMTAEGLHVSSEAIGGGLPVVGDFPPIDRAGWERATAGREVKEVTLLQLDDEAHYEVRLSRIPVASVDRNGHDRLVVAASTLRPRRVPFATETLVERLDAALPTIPIAGAIQLDSYDSYYYGRGADRPPLPVIRIRFADPMQTWSTWTGR